MKGRAAPEEKGESGKFLVDEGLAKGYMMASMATGKRDKAVGYFRLDASLLRGLDAWARREGLNRTQLVERVLRASVELERAFGQDADGGMGSLFGKDFEDKLGAIAERVLERVLTAGDVVSRAGKIAAGSERKGRVR